MAKSKEQNKDSIEQRPTMIFRASFVFGRYLYYPANPLAEEAIKIFDSRANKKSFVKDQVLFFKNLGINVEILKDDKADL